MWYKTIGTELQGRPWTPEVWTWQLHAGIKLTLIRAFPGSASLTCGGEKLRGWHFMARTPWDEFHAKVKAEAAEEVRRLAAALHNTAALLEHDDTVPTTHDAS